MVFQTQEEVPNFISPELPFDKGKIEIEMKGYHIPSLEENAKLRIQGKNFSLVSCIGNWVKENFLYISKEERYMTKIPLSEQEAKYATRAHEKGDEFYLIPERANSFLKGAFKLPNKDFSIPTTQFGDRDDTGLTNYIFGDTAEDYGDFLNDSGIKIMPVLVGGNSSWDNYSIRKVYFNNLDNYSEIECTERNLYYDQDLLGILNSVSL